MNSETVLLVNAIVYSITLLYFLKKYGFSAGICIWGLYTLSAWSSYFFIQQPYYAISVHKSEQTWFPCIYLYFIFIVSMYPLFKLNHIKDIRFSNPNILKFLMMFSIIIQIIFIVVDFPTVISILSSGTGLLSSLRDTLYDDGLSAVTRIGLLNKFSLFYSGFRILATGFSVILLYYNPKNRKLTKVFFFITLLNNIRMIIVMVSRGELVSLLLLYCIVFFLIRNRLSKEAKKKILLYGIPVLGLSMVFLIAITVSRFGDRMEYFFFKYLGESINNFNGVLFKNINGTTKGRAYFSLFYTLLGSEKIATTNQKWELINSAIGIPANIFYTWVGGLIIEFSKVAPIIVSIVFNRILRRIVKQKSFFPGDIIILIFFLNFFLRGIFVFPTQNYEGMFMILYTFILYFAFRIKKRDGRIVYLVPSKRFRIRR